MGVSFPFPITGVDDISEIRGATKREEMELSDHSNSIPTLSPEKHILNNKLTERTANISGEDSKMSGIAKPTTQA